jgi:hypothetical protein
LTISIITINSSLYSKLMNRENFEIKCYKCGLTLNINDKCVSKVNSTLNRNGISRGCKNGQPYRIYCIKCADELNMI